MVKRLDIMREHARAHTFTLQEQDYHIPQLLINNLIFQGNVGTCEKTDYLASVSELTHYADGFFDMMMYRNDDDDNDTEVKDENAARTEDPSTDQFWYQWSKTNLCGGFNHVKNYCELAKMTSWEGDPIEISEGFLVLEARDGQINMPSVDTVKEMYVKYYGMSPELYDALEASKAKRTPSF